MTREHAALAHDSEATLRQAQERSADELQMVSFTVDAQEYGIAIHSVQEIVQTPDRITEVPTTEPHVLGVMSLRNRLLSLTQAPETAYVDQDAVARELAAARRIFADRGWPVIDVTRRSIEETAAAIINLISERESKAATPA